MTINSYHTFDPLSGNPPEQLVLLLHGYGSNKDDLISLAPDFAEALPSAVFVSPNAPFPCDMGLGYQWFGITAMDMNTALRGGEIAAPLLNDFIDEQLEKYGLTDEQLVLAGFSQGSMMSLYCGLRRERTCAGILGYSGMLADDGALEDAVTAKPPVCLIHGEMDDVVPFHCLGLAEDALQALGVDVETHARPNLPHGIDGQGIQIGQQFLSRLFA